MESTARKTVIVLGASGRQGGSTARYLLSATDFRVCAISRNAKNPKLAELEALGAEVQQASFDDPESLESAFSGACAIFANTNFANTRSVDAEYQQGINIANAASGVQSLEHFVWSGAFDVESLSAGKYKNVIHMKAKARVTRYIKGELLQLAAITTEVFVPPYFENWMLMPGLYGPILKRDDKLWLSLPVSGETHWPSIPIRDIGKVIGAILDNPSKARGHSVNGAFETMDLEHMLKQWGERSGAAVEYEKVTPEKFESRNVAEYAKLFGGEETAAMFVRAASEQMQFMEDITMGRLPIQDVLQIQDVATADLDVMRWNHFVVSAVSK